MRQRRVSASVLVVAGLAFVVLAVLLVPWSPVPGGAPDPVPADQVFTPAAIARAEDVSGSLRAWGWASLSTGGKAVWASFAL